MYGGAPAAPLAHNEIKRTLLKFHERVWRSRFSVVAPRGGTRGSSGSYAGLNREESADSVELLALLELSSGGVAFGRSAAAYSPEAAAASATSAAPPAIVYPTDAAADEAARAPKATRMVAAASFRLQADRDE